MGRHRVNISLSDDDYRLLVCVAAESGQTPTSFVHTHLLGALRRVSPGDSQRLKEERARQVHRAALSRAEVFYEDHVNQVAPVQVPDDLNPDLADHPKRQLGILRKELLRNDA